MKKKSLSMLLVLVMLCSVFTPALADNGENYPVPLYSVEDFFFLPETVGFSVTPDGQSLLYLAQANGVFNIFKRDLATGKETQLTSEPEHHIKNFFLKENTVLYLRDTHGDELTQIYRVNADGTSTNLTPYPGVLAIPMSLLEDTNADEEIIVAMNRDDPQRFNVYRLNVITGETTKVMDAAMDNLAMDNEGTIRVYMAIDGMQFTMYHRYTDDDEFKEVKSWTIDENAVPLFFDVNNKYVYAVSNVGRNTYAVVRMDPATGEELEVISSHADVDVYSLMLWEPGVLGAAVYITDRPQLEFFSDKMESWYKDIASLFGNDQFISITSTSDDLNINIVSASSDVSLGGTYLVNLKNRTVELLADRNGEIDPEHMAPMQSVTYKARDGLAIPGYLTLPVGVKPESLPLVVIPHGGPWHRDTWGFNAEAQFLANRGYAVLQPNFRTSSGYGRDFQQAGYGQWGLAMQDDISDGVLWLIEQGIADPDRVAIYGASYGGYAALAGAAYTPDLYAAVISYVGVSNIFTFLDSFPPYWESQREMLYHRIGHPERDYERLMATSPVFSADKITAPLFIAHGANDPRVALDESLQIISALNEHGIDVEFYVAWDEGHGFINDANTEIFYRVMEVFFAEHLGGRTLTRREDLPNPLFDLTPLENWGKGRFADVQKGDWFYDAIEYVFLSGLMQGTSADKFSPNIATTRGMIATIMHRLAGSPDPDPESETISVQFSDVIEGAWYYDAVIWAVENGIIYGVGDDTFAPNAPSTRQSLALVFSNFADCYELELPELVDYSGFDDSADIDSNTAAAVERLFKAGVINGKPGNIFDPSGSATRAELATMLKRFIELIAVG